MKRILLIFMLISAALGLYGQGFISDPFFNPGQARLLNTQIIAPTQNVPGLVNQAIFGMRVPSNRNITLLAHLKDDYGYAVWDQAKTFTSAGRETALIPMVQPTGNSISGVLVAVRDGNRFVYGVMDLENPFPYASVPLGSTGMPDMRDVTGLSVIFNHLLFGAVDCNLIQALRTASAGNIKETDVGSPKSCFVQVTLAGQNCHHIYGQYPDGTQQYLYSDCTPIYNYSLVCDTDAADSGDEGGVGGGGGGGGSGGNGSVSDSGMQENEAGNSATCNTVVTVLELSGIYSESRTCYIQVSASGCDFSNCNLFFEGGDLACGATINSEFLGLSFPVGVAYQMGNPICIASRTSFTNDSQAGNYIICGNLYVRFELLYSVFGITDSFGIVSRNISRCYRCHNC